MKLLINKHEILSCYTSCLAVRSGYYSLVASLSMFDLEVCLHVFSYLFNSDHNGWTALHHASMGGYTQTMKVILDTNLKCTDRLDEEGVGTRSL